MSDEQASVVFEPSPESAEASQLMAFLSFCETRTGQRFVDHADFHDFSVTCFRDFWDLFLAWSGLVVEGSRDPVCVGDEVETAQFYPGLQLSYVENLLREIPEAEDELALVAHHDSRDAVRISRSELRRQVRAVADSLERRGLGAGDRVVAVSANIEQLVVTGLAAMALGATLSSVGPDLGTPAVLARFEQLEPVLLLYGVHDAQMLSSQGRQKRLRELVAGLRTLRGVVVLDDLSVSSALDVEVSTFTQLLDEGAATDETAPWRRFPFSHPLWVLFSSGTTGAPKCIVHTAGGALLEHVKEHVLHGDLRPEDVLFFQTSPAWMMWNWQLSALATGATIVLNDGPVPDPGSLWSIVERERATVFGTGPAYLQFCESSDYGPAEHHDLTRLRTVMSTGSVLQDHQYDWVRAHVGELPLQSISGGTDIVGCFLLGHPALPVHRGELQCRSLGLDVRAVDVDVETGVGELTCQRPFPSRPSGLLGDTSGEAFHAAYFSQHPGVWTHGDLVELTAHGSARMRGRSDGVMNINGVRIAPAELYSHLVDLPELAMSMAVEQQLPEGPEQSRLVLMVVMAPGHELDHTLEVRIRQAIGRGASPVHVPGLIVAVDELPRTHNGKESERAARDALDGEEVVNATALRNPGSLEEIRSAVAAADRARDRSHLVLSGGLSGDRADLVPDLAALFSLVLDVPVDEDDSFFDLGGTSLAIAHLCAAIEEHLGHDLPFSSVFSAPTPRRLAAHITDGHVGLDRHLVTLREGTPGLRPIFMLFDITGDVVAYLQLVSRLPGRRPVHGVLARGIDGRSDVDRSVEDMAEAALDSIRLMQPGGTYTLMGYSFGGLVAYEVAHRLMTSGMEVDHVVLLDTYVDHHALPAAARWRYQLLGRPRQWFGWLRQAQPAQVLQQVLRRVLRRANVDGAGRPLTPVRASVRLAIDRALGSYRPPPFSRDVLLVRSAVAPASMCDPLPVWRDVVAGGHLTVTTVAGDHLDMMQPPYVEEVARRVSPLLGDDGVVVPVIARGA